MKRYKYKAISETGKIARGVMSAASEVDLHAQLGGVGMELIDCSEVSSGGGIPFLSGMKKISLRDQIQVFIQLEQLQGAGVALLDSLADVRDSVENPRLKDVITDIHRHVSDGGTFSEGMSNHPTVFSPLYVSLVAAGESTGDMVGSYRQLIKFLKWVDDMQSKVRKATRYPMIVTGVVILTIAIMMMVVVPQITSFLGNIGQELPIYTTALMAVSDFFAEPLFHIAGIPVYGGLIFLLTPVAIFFAIKAVRNSSEEMAYRIDKIALRMPVSGPLIKKIAIARYSQTFGALFASGITVLDALAAARETVSNVALKQALEEVERSVREGSSLSQAFAASGEFPTLVVRMLKVGEESGKLTPVLEQVSEFYTRDVDEAVQGLIAGIEPALTGVMGGMILWIAVAVFGPIYGSFADMDF